MLLSHRIVPIINSRLSIYWLYFIGSENFKAGRGLVEDLASLYFPFIKEGTEAGSRGELEGVPALDI